MAEINITELDFANIKTNLKTYLSAQTEFTDFDFSGSALNVMLDVLAYNTHYNAVLANLQANEMFIDSAIKRSSVISLAKMLGYTPRSVTSSKAYVDLSVVQDAVEASTLSITPNIIFSAEINGTSYTFNVNESQTATVNDAGNFVFTDVELIEGLRVANDFTIRSDTVSGPLVIPVQNIDTTTVTVSVQASSSDFTTTTFTKHTSIADVTNISKAFWLEENSDGAFQVMFGDDIIGAKLISGNIVTVSYVISAGSASNGCRNFTLVGDIDGETQVNITINTPASGGNTRESIDSIRYNAPKFNANRNRAVTSQDYRTLIKQNFPKAREVAVWGGEENSPPIYGKVFISIDPIVGAVLTEADKDYITETLLRPRSVMSIQHEFVDPEYLYIGLEAAINYNPKLTTLKSSDISVLAKAEVTDYFNTELGTLDTTFFLSRVSERVKAVEPSIVSSLFKMRIQKRIAIVTNTKTAYSKTLNFLTAISPETFRSSNFQATISGLVYSGFLQDYSDDTTASDTGTGKIYFVDSVTRATVTQVGTINYAAGIVTLSNVNVTAYLGGVNELYLTCRPQPLYQNITSNIVRTSDTSTFAVASRPAINTIITMDDSVSDADANITSGLVFNSTPYTA